MTSKRDIGKEILAGLDEIAGWKRGEWRLRTTKVELPRAAPGDRASSGESSTCAGIARTADAAG